MKSVTLSLPSLLLKVNEMIRGNMNFVKPPCCSEAIDEYRFAPGFLHFEAIRTDGLFRDSESIESLSLPEPVLPRVSQFSIYFTASERAEPAGLNCFYF